MKALGLVLLQSKAKGGAKAHINGLGTLFYIEPMKDGTKKGLLPLVSNFEKQCQYLVK